MVKRLKGELQRLEDELSEIRGEKEAFEKVQSLHCAYLLLPSSIT